MSNELVMIRGKIYSSTDKGPFEILNHGPIGAVYYDAEENKIQCHECGDWYRSLSRHALVSHGIESREYKSKYGICLGSPLIVPELSDIARRRAYSIELWNGGGQLIQGASSGRKNNCAEVKNESFRCVDQLKIRVKKLAEDLGRIPSQKEIQNAGIGWKEITVDMGFNNSREMIVAVLGKSPSRIRGKRELSDDEIIESIRKFIADNNRQPSIKDLRPPLMPCYGIIHERIGGIRKAVIRACALLDV